MADQSARLAFILSLTDKVTGPASKIKNTITDLADAGAANIVRMGAGFIGMRESFEGITALLDPCLLYTSPSPRDVEESRMPSSA